VFEVSYQIEDSLMDCQVPKFFLQPFVENSIIHAFTDMDELGIIKILGKKCGELIKFEVIDNGKGMDQQTIERILKGSDDSIGIPNVLQRIQLLYGPESGLLISSSSEETVISIIIQL